MSGRPWFAADSAHRVRFVSGFVRMRVHLRLGLWCRARVQLPASEVAAGYPLNSSPVLMFGYSAMLSW